MAHDASESPYFLACEDVLVRWTVVGPAPPAAERSAMAALLSDSERERLERFVFEDDAWHYLVAHMLLRRTLSEGAAPAPEAWSFRAAAGGRPEVERPERARRLRFSLSHTRGLVACAVCLDHPVGIDVERVVPALLPADTASRILGSSESEALATLADAARLERLFALWTLKEACLKARGEGLAEPPSSVCFSFPAEGPPTVAFAVPIRDDPAAWRFHSVLLESGHALAVALRRPPRAAVRFLLQGAPPDQKNV